MDLGTRPRATVSLLARLGDRVRAREASVVEEWGDIVAWAGDHVVSAPQGAATLSGGFLDTGVPVAGDGAPLVSEFALMELVAVLGRTPDGGRAYAGRVLACAWRLPRVYAAVLDGRLAPWRAERIADLTHALSAEAAGFVDRQLYDATGVGWAQLERLVAEATLRFDPERAEAERVRATDQRRFDLGEVDQHGLVHLDALLDAADGRDLDLAVARRAEVLGRLGDESSLDVRRSKAAAELARQDLALDLLIPDPDTGAAVATVPGRKVVLNVHVTDTSLAGANPVARWDEGRCPVTTAQVREWLQTRDTTIIVRPVIDLADHVPVDSYEIPDRHRTRVTLRDPTCRFPHCTRPTTRCDLDHATPHHRGGPTCPCNLVPLCRRHHRAKTHSRWRYDIPAPATYVWTSPAEFRFRVDHRGTHPLPPPDE